MPGNGQTRCHVPDTLALAGARRRHHKLHLGQRHQLTGINFKPPGQANRVTSYAYGANGNRASRTENGSVNATYHYDALNRLTGFNGAGDYGYDVSDH